MLIDLSCPVENHKTIVKTNSETQQPYLLLKLFNLSEKIITSLSFRVLIYDANGTSIGMIPVELCDLSAEPKSYFAENKAISLEGIENAKHFVVQIDHVLFQDGSEYRISEENIVEVDETHASVDEALLLRSFVKDAVCFSAEHDTYWRCVCGRANLPSIKHCLRCGSDKSDILEHFSSEEALQLTLEKKEQEEAAKKAEEEAALAAERIEKAKKTKKSLFIVMIAIVVAAILFVAGFFVYRVVLNSIADKATENGDYEKAYELYEKTGSDKIGEISSHVLGNTQANLMFQSGLITADDENLYYLAFDQPTYSFQLLAENKQTKEKTVLTDAAGGSLNVTKDWIYFVDIHEGFIKRISKDGQTTETILEKGVSYLSVIGNTIYYIQTDYNNPNHLDQEQCEILAAQNQMETYQHLYKMNIDQLKPVLVSDENMNTCYIQGNRIFYLTKTEDEWTSSNLCSMNLQGKDKQTIVDTPVASFYIDNDILYYIQMYNPDLKGQAIDANALSYTLMQKDLKTGEEKALASDYMPTYLNANKDKLFFIALNRASFYESLNGSSETQSDVALYVMDKATGAITTLVIGEVNMFNVMEDEVIMYLSSQGMCRVKADSSGFEQILPTTTQDNADTEDTNASDVVEENLAESAE